VRARSVPLTNSASESSKTQGNVYVSNVNDDTVNEDVSSTSSEENGMAYIADRKKSFQYHPMKVMEATENGAEEVPSSGGQVSVEMATVEDENAAKEMYKEDTADPASPDDSKNRLIVGGIIAAVILAGGVIAWRGTKKRKAA